MSLCNNVFMIYTPTEMVNAEKITLLTISKAELQLIIVGDDLLPVAIILSVSLHTYCGGHGIIHR